MILYGLNKLIRLSYTMYHDPLKRLKMKTFAFDGVIKNDHVTKIPLLMYYVKLYMLHP